MIKLMKLLTWALLAVPPCLFFAMAGWWGYSALFLDFESTMVPFLYCMCAGFGVIIECLLAQIIFG